MRIKLGTHAEGAIDDNKCDMDEGLTSFTKKESDTEPLGGEVDYETARQKCI